MNAVSASRSNGHLLRCRLRIRSSRTEQYAPVRVLAGALHLTHS